MGNLFGFVAADNTLDLSALEKEEKISNEDLREIINNLYEILQRTTLAINQAPEMISKPSPNIFTSGEFAVIVGSTTPGEQPAVKKLTTRGMGLIARFYIDGDYLVLGP